MQTCEESTYDTLKIPKYNWCQSLNSPPKKLYGFTKKKSTCYMCRLNALCGILQVHYHSLTVIMLVISWMDTTNA